MGRELRRKQAKKEGKSLEREELIEKNSIKKYVIITSSLIIVLTILYFVTALFITKELDWFNKKDNDTSESNSISNTILASATFKQSETEYYVYFYDFNEEKNSITDIVNNKLSGEKVYKVNTASAMNTNYVGETGNKNAKTLEELKVVAPTLIKISEDKIVKYYEGKEITDNL